MLESRSRNTAGLLLVGWGRSRTRGANVGEMDDGAEGGVRERINEWAGGGRGSGFNSREQGCRRWFLGPVMMRPQRGPCQSVHHLEPEIVVLENSGHISIKIWTMIVPLWIMIDFDVFADTGGAFQMNLFSKISWIYFM